MTSDPGKELRAPVVKAKSNRLVRQAAQRNPLLSRKGVMERLFAFWFDSLVYNQIWEDPRVDLEALQLRADSRVVTIASGGCNVLNYLVEGPASITAVDINRYHIYLTRLKLVSLEMLPSYDAFFRFFGCADVKENLSAFAQHISPRLDEETREFWQGGSWLRTTIAGPRIEYFAHNLYNYAKLGYLLRFVHTLCRIARKDPSRVLKAESRQQQEAIFDETIAPMFDNRLVRLIGRQPLIMFSLGIPPQQYEEIKREQRGDVIELYRERVRRLICEFPIQDNYFTWQALSRRYDIEHRRALPEYLKPDGYAACRRHIGRAQAVISPMTQYLRGQPDASLDRFVLLDSQDWMSPAQIEELWAQIARVGKPGTRIIFRTGSSLSPVEAALPSDLRSRFQHDAAASRALHAKDRAAIYGGFHLYVMPH